MKLNEAIVKMANSDDDCVMVHTSGLKIESKWAMSSPAMRLYIQRDIKELPEDGWSVESNENLD